MRFLSLTIENMFAYGGEASKIELSDCSAERNIVVVSGPNGAGKTSLLNAVKLLFLGPNSEELRRVGLVGTPLTPKQYVNGLPGRWYGVFNIEADKAATAQVTLDWIDTEKAMRARRWFRRQRGTTEYEHGLDVTIDGEAVSAEEGEGILQQMLPREVVRLFFFDGEQIQALADAEVGHERAEIERLLGLSFVVELLGQLHEYQKERGRAGIPEVVQVRIVAAENAAREETARAEAAARAREAHEEEVMDLDRAKVRLQDEARRLRGGTLSESERRRILSRIAVLESQRETLAERLADALPPESVFLTQPELIARSFEILNTHVGSGTDPSLANRLYRELPERLVRALAALDPPITLGEKQRSAYAGTVDASLREIGVPTGSLGDPLMASLSARDAARLRDQFLVWSERGRQMAQDHRDLLVEMRQIASELQRLRRELDEAELTSDEAKARHEEIMVEIEDGEKRARAAGELAAAARIEEQRALRDAAAQHDRARAEELEHEHVKMENGRYRLALEMIRALDDYRIARRAEIRASVETRLNEKIGILLAASQLVKSVRLDDGFGMEYLDSWGEKVARHSISAGMRQLIAMAMLWALKDEADRPLPVIVDTPLGRIDRENRKHLMQQYFPAAGNPLVLLPTDTEFGDEGYDAIGDRIRRRYSIVNQGGTKARIVEDTSTTGGRRRS